MKHFKDLGLAESLLRALTAEGYTEPTPIQAAVIPAMLAGQDVLGIAQTGTGKTASFVLPLLQQIATRTTGATAPADAARSCAMLILTPTRELAAQIVDSIQGYGRFMRLSVALVVGGVKPGPQIKALAPGVDIVVATPGRFLDHLSAGVVRLDRATTIVLDEADQMLDLGFMPAIRRIMSRLPKTRQTVLMSATMPAPIRKLALEFQTDPTEISVTPVSRPIERITQSVVAVESAGKAALLTRLLSGHEVQRAIVFTRTKRGADKVNAHLLRAGLSAVAIHGNKNQAQRDRALASFRQGETPILVATDVAARGIDVDNVSHVVNFELPNVAEAYVHRIGRTARAGRSGVAISLCSPAERGLLRDIERLIGAQIAQDPEITQAPLPREAAGPTPVRARKPEPQPVHQQNKDRPAARVRTVTEERYRQLDSDAPMAGLLRMLGNIGPAKVAAA